MNLYLLQWFLVVNGFNTGPIDGVIGPKTRKAIKDFQIERNMKVTGTVTAEIVEAYQTQMQPTVWPNWLHYATWFLGLEEMPGEDDDNPVILNWAKELGNSHYKKDKTAWCGLFVAAMLKRADSRIKLPKEILKARAYKDENFGQTVRDENEANFGDVIVFWRDNPKSWKGHVGFYMGRDREYVLALGGNQNNSVSINRYEAEQLLEIVRPV